jgi:hypothetical protein
MEVDTQAIYTAPPPPAEAQLLVAAALHLMSHYATCNAPCVKLASVVQRHLQALATMPDLQPVLRATCDQLSEQWRVEAERAAPAPQRFGFLKPRLRRPAR